MHSVILSHRWFRLVAFLLAVLATRGITSAEEKPEVLHPGLRVEVRAGQSVDVFSLSNLSWYVEAGSPATAFLKAGSFQAVCVGQLRVDLRSDFLFQLESSGSAELIIRSNEVVRVGGTNGSSGLSKPVRLTKGLNEIVLRFASPPQQGASFFRVSWGEKPFLMQPIPGTQLSHAVDAKESLATTLRVGRELFADLRCGRCHVSEVGSTGMPEMSMDAPGFEGIGLRRNQDWMRRWILDPKAMRPTAHMPKLLLGADAESQAIDIAAYLGSLTSETKTVSLKDPLPWTQLTPPAASTPAGTGVEVKPLFESLHCGACHLAPGEKADDPTKIALTHVREKFPAGRLVEFLRQPNAHYAWIRMPNFRLTEAEARLLAAFLEKDLPPPAAVSVADLALSVQRGRESVSKLGCLKCHSGGGTEDQSSAPALASVSAEHWHRGCLAPGPEISGKSPRYALSPSERAALKAWGQTDHASLSRYDAVEFAQRSTRALRCTTCHGAFEGFPPLEVLGGKLQPGWVAAFLKGEVPYKPRPEKHPRGEPWLDARMPAFPAYASRLADGLAATHGWSGTATELGPVDEKMALIGRRLVGKVGGFSCVSCHAVNTLPAMEVFDSEGINLAFASRRLRRSYFDRWMRLPIAIDSQTKMPAYFDEEGKSPLGEVFEGDAAQQLDAVWEYLKQGERMSMPASGDGGAVP